MDDETIDLLVVGGGINGAGIARDAAGRGLRVLLCEQGDLAGATSSASSKLIHGGLRYLEQREFRLVREALQEREVLLGIAPHIAWPLRFVLPHARGQRPAWMIRLGLFLYDHIGGRRHLPGTRRLDLRRDDAGKPLNGSARIGFEYSDCWVDDARLVVLNALDARERGAEIRTRTTCLAARRDGGRWTAELQDVGTGARREVAARAVVNAAGPWVGEMLNERAALHGGKQPRLIKGSHIVVPRLYVGDQAYILQNDDSRVVFVIPYERDFSLIGTTDVPFAGNPAEVAVSAAETDYLCRAVARYFRRPIVAADVVHQFSGVRALFDDAASAASEVTRDYVLDLDIAAGAAPILSVFGGKITTYRRLAEHALEKLLPYLPAPRPAPWTTGTALPGGDLPDAGHPDAFARFVASLRIAHPWLPPATALRLARAYGSRTARVLRGATDLSGLGADFGGGLTEAELDYLICEEWARSAEDVLWRRSKLGLRLSAPERDAVAAFLAQRR